MHYQPIHKRKYHAFLSHSSRDKAHFVDQMFEWFSENAKIPVWYDKDALAGGAPFASYIANSIPQCRSLIIILSESSVKSGWVEEEYSLALDHQKQYKQFKIIPVVIDNCEVPGFLKTRTHIRFQESEDLIDFYNALLQAIYYEDIDIEFRNNQDIYVSRTWHDNEAKFADAICKQFDEAHFRLIGDAEDQPDFSDNKQRVSEIISSCGGLLAILPYRKNKMVHGYTSEYILEEIWFARHYNLPYIILAETGVEIPEDIQSGAAYIAQSTESNDVSQEPHTSAAVDVMHDVWIKDHKRHYIFFATSFDVPKRNQSLRRAIQRITAMQCIIGDDLQGSRKVSVQEQIIDQIRHAFLLIGDITHDNINSLFEVGVARGANIPINLIAHEPRKKPPFMLRDAEVSYYATDADLLGCIHRIVYPYRRRILNQEL